MAVQIGAKPDSGFDDPIGMLKDCHRRIERFLDILHLVVRKAHNRALTTDETRAVESALHYFRESGPRHTQDEEQSLFPRLRAAGAADVLLKISGLERDHRAAEELHAEAAHLYCLWIAQGALDAVQLARLQAATGELARIYSTHIALEDGIVFPRAKAILAADDIESMAVEFRKRRELA